MTDCCTVGAQPQTRAVSRCQRDLNSPNVIHKPEVNTGRALGFPAAISLRRETDVRRMLYAIDALNITTSSPNTYVRAHSVHTSGHVHIGPVDLRGPRNWSQNDAPSTVMPEEVEDRPINKLFKRCSDYW